MSTYAAWPEPEVARGRAGVREFFRRFLGTWSDYHAEFDDFVDIGGEVVVTVRDGGRGRGSGVVVEREWAQVWTVENGAVVRFRPFETRAEALAAMGRWGRLPESARPASSRRDRHRAGRPCSARARFE